MIYGLLTDIIRIVTGNGFQTIPEGMFHGSLARTLQRLHISHCPNLTTVADGSLTNLLSLTTLIISQNPVLSRLPQILTASNLQVNLVPGIGV